MLKNVFLIIVLALAMIAYGSKATTLLTQYKEPQNYGIFKLYVDEYDTFIITRKKWFNLDFTFKQIENLLGNSYQDYYKFNNANQKALFIYQFLSKVATKADFEARLRNSQTEKHLDISIIKTSAYKYSHGHMLIPHQDMKTVYPLLLNLIKSQTRIDFELNHDSKNRPTISSVRHQTIEHTPAQAWEIAGTFHYDVNLPTAEDKALKIYLLLIDLARQANFKVKFSDEYPNNNPVMLYITAQGLEQGIELELIPNNEAASVYPLLIEFTKDRPSTHYKTPQIVDLNQR